MNFKRLLFSFVLLFSSLSAPAHADVKVAASIPSLAALVRAVGGNDVSVTPLSLPTQDPHFVDARPSLALTLNKANLLVVAGLQLEVGWLPVLQSGARNPAILSSGDGYLDCSSAVKLKETATGPLDRSKGDIHPGGNPHYLTDPMNAELCAKAIADKLAALDPAHAKDYAARYQKFAGEVDAKVKDWTAQLAPYAGTPVVVYHRSWVYLLDWIKFKETGALEPKPGIPPTPAHVASILGDMQRTKTKLVLQESFYPDATSHLLAERTGAKVIEVPGGPKADQTYLQYMDDMVQSIIKAIRS
jgi:zinc/manganese transport system substrate-binding protein